MLLPHHEHFFLLFTPNSPTFPCGNKYWVWCQACGACALGGSDKALFTIFKIRNIASDMEYFYINSENPSRLAAHARQALIFFHRENLQISSFYFKDQSQKENLKLNFLNHFLGHQNGHFFSSSKNTFPMVQALKTYTFFFFLQF